MGAAFRDVLIEGVSKALPRRYQLPHRSRPIHAMKGRNCNAGPCIGPPAAPGPLVESLIVLIGLAAVVFASTNIDDVFVLLGFFADPKFRARDVVIGPLSCMRK